MRTDSFPDFAWKLTLNGQTAGFLASVAVPTETSIMFGQGLVVGEFLSDWAFDEMQGQRRIMSGNLITLDTNFRPIYCDAWDSSFIQKAEISALDTSRSELLTLTLTLQVTNLREVPLPPPGASTIGPLSRANARKSQLRQRVFGRTSRSTVTPAYRGRRDSLPSFCFKVALSGSSTNIFVSKLGPLTYSSGVIAPVVITMAETAAADFRAWKQAGGQRDITVQCLDTALQVAFTVIYRGCTITQIVPAVPINPVDPTSVTLNIGGLTITY
ncbi:hypothetical protein [Terrarubrum flagellatum]|uniref:hypothetical protein n=1 Tax=Terrirubrum flagellatum TaxID=2895980 RepID=UPI0031451BE7